MSFEQFYGLTEQPFSNAPDPRFYYESSQHGEAMIRLMHSVNTMKGLVCLIGDVGTGKTLLARKSLDVLQSQESKYEPALIVMVHTEVSADWLLKKIATQLGVKDPAETKSALLTQLLNKLVEVYEAGKKAVIIIDEANMLQTKEIFEEFRGLLNLEVPGQKLITIVLIGLPELDKYMALDEALQQRVASKFMLRPLSIESTEGYVKHRLQVAGCTREIFNADALRAIFRYSRGTPRLINNICDNALLEGYLQKRDAITGELIDTVCKDLGLKGE